MICIVARTAVSFTTHNVPGILGYSVAKVCTSTHDQAFAFPETNVETEYRRMPAPIA